MKELIPAIMPKDFGEIKDKANLVKDKVKTIQLDLMDGVYVLEKTWPFFNLKDKKFINIQEQKESLPFWEEVNYELDLMISEPEKNIEQWLNLSPGRIIFHFESIKDFSKIEKIDFLIRDFIEIGFAVGINTPIKKLIPFIENDYIDFVQFMGINKIGYQGQEFNEKVLEEIKKLHERYPELPISIDGGVSKENIKDLIKAGVTRIVSGSAVFGGESVGENIKKFELLF